MDPGDSMSSGQVHDASTSVMADAVNATVAASSEYRVMYFVMLSVHCLTVVIRCQMPFQQEDLSHTHSRNFTVLLQGVCFW